MRAVHRFRTLLVTGLLTLAAASLHAADAADATDSAGLRGSAAARVERVVGTSLEIVDADGRRRIGEDLAGVELRLGEADTAPHVRIVSVRADAGGRGVLLHEVEMREPGSVRWSNICDVDRDGQRLALFIEGHDLPDGRQLRVPGRVSLTCTAGVQAKCLRAGYLPFVDPQGPGSGVELFQACTRMYRADYCGDGIGWTRNGMAIDPFDIHRIQRPEEPATLPFEAAWGKDGAVCVHHTRVAERGGLDALIAHCPRLAESPVGAACTEGGARTLPGVLMFNRSADTTAGDGPPIAR